MGAVLFRDGSCRGSLGLGGHRFELINSVGGKVFWRKIIHRIFIEACATSSLRSSCANIFSDNW